MVVSLESLQERSACIADQGTSIRLLEWFCSEHILPTNTPYYNKIPSLSSASRYKQVDHILYAGIRATINRPKTEKKGRRRVIFFESISFISGSS